MNCHELLPIKQSFIDDNDMTMCLAKIFTNNLEPPNRTNKNRRTIYKIKTNQNSFSFQERKKTKMYTSISAQVKQRTTAGLNEKHTFIRCSGTFKMRIASFLFLNFLMITIIGLYFIFSL